MILLPFILLRILDTIPQVKGHGAFGQLCLSPDPVNAIFRLEGNLTAVATPYQPIKRSSVLLSQYKMDAQGFLDMQPQANKIGENFCKTYYDLFDRDRSTVLPLYHTAMAYMTFEGDTRLGAENIGKKFTELPFKTVQHVVTSVDCHATVDQSVLIAVLGQLKTDQDPATPFHETFILKQFEGTFYIVNDIFRLGLHNF